MICMPCPPEVCKQEMEATRGWSYETGYDIFKKWQPTDNECRDSESVLRGKCDEPKHLGGPANLGNYHRYECGTHTNTNTNTKPRA